MLKIKKKKKKNLEGPLPHVQNSSVLDDNVGENRLLSLFCKKSSTMSMF